MYKLGIWIVHPQKFSIEHDGKEVKLKSLIMKLLLLFIESEGKAISKEELLEKCWHGRVVTDDAIRQAIKELRSALNSHNDNIEYIQTIRKHGYRLLPDVELITTAQETPFALFFKKHKITLIFLIAILLIATLLGFIYQNYSYRLSKDSTIITYDKKRETDYDINSEGWDAYIIIRPDFYYGESIIVRDQEKNHIHTILPSHNEGHIENVKFSPNGELLVYLDFSIENCKIRIINVKSGKNVHNIECQKSDYYVALDWYTDNEIFYSTSTSESLPLELRLYNIDTKEQKPVTNPVVGGRGDYFVRACNENKSFILRNIDSLTVQIVSFDIKSKQEKLIMEINDDSVVSVDWLPNCESLAIFLKTKGIYALNMGDGKLTAINENIRGVKSLRVVKDHLYVAQGRYCNKSIISIDTKEELSPKVLVESRGSNRTFIKNPVTDSFAFISSRSGSHEVWLYENKKYTQLSNFEKRLNDGAFAWSSDGKSILLVEDNNIWAIEVNTFNVNKVKEVNSTILSLVSVNENEWLYSAYENNLWQGYLWNAKTQNSNIISNLTIKTFKKNNNGDIFFRTQDDAIYRYIADSDQYELMTSIDAGCSDWIIEKSTLYCLDDEGLKKRNLSQDKMEIVFEDAGIGQYFFLENEHKFYFEKTNSGAMDIHKYTLTNNIF